MYRVYLHFDILKMSIFIPENSTRHRHQMDVVKSAISRK